MLREIVPSLCEPKKFQQSKHLLINSTTTILLQTAVVKIAAENNPEGVLARVIFDSGSEKSFVSERICKQLSRKLKRVFLFLHLAPVHNHQGPLISYL